MSACSGGGDNPTSADVPIQEDLSVKADQSTPTESAARGVTISIDSQGQLVINGVTVVTGTKFGEPLRGLSQGQIARFAAGRDTFAEVEDVADGLGPVFNDTACGNCHDASAVGGAGITVETRFGRSTNGSFDPLAQFGGSLIQTTGIGPITKNGKTCNYVGETVPSQANVVAGRLTTPLFGAGLVDAVPDGTFAALARSEASQNPSAAGVVAMVANVVTGGTSVGKFGWKSQVPSLLQFSGDAYINEMGITNRFFPQENCPQGDCSLLACDPVADSEDTDDDVDLFADFMRFLGPPPLGSITSDVVSGAKQFASLGCGNCHVPSLRTGPSSDPAFNQVTFAPFSDFLLHDMGRLGDGIVQGPAGATQMRTAPLWGARGRTKYLHDGTATTLADAIKAHKGQGQSARDKFVGLTTAQQAQVVAFIKAL